HGGDLQGRREDDLRQRGSSERSITSVQFQPGGEHAAGHRFPRGREDKRASAEDSRACRRGSEQVRSVKSQGTESEVSAIVAVRACSVRCRRYFLKSNLTRKA